MKEMYRIWSRVQRLYPKLEGEYSLFSPNPLRKANAEARYFFFLPSNAAVITRRLGGRFTTIAFQLFIMVSVLSCFREARPKAINQGFKDE